MRRPWAWALLLALAWGVLPALPALLHGHLIGQPFTDLYPSVWGLHWFAAHQPGLPTMAPELAWPDGAGFYYSSPIHGWAAWPLLAAGLPLPWVWNLTLLAARLAGPLLAFTWLRAEGLEARGALVGAALFGCAPTLHGYAVEGIVEGTDAWTLALWGLLLARRRPLAAAAAFALVVASSWYLGLAGLMVAAARTREGPRAPLTALGGTLLALPLWFLFHGAFSAAAPLDPAVRVAMGTALTLPRPGLLSGLNPFALTSYLGFVALGLFALGARRRPWLAAGAALCWLLSTGWGPWYALPGLAMVRFPYRLVVAALFLAAPIAGLAAQRWRYGAWLAAAIVAEGLLLSPVEPILPEAPAALPAPYAEVAPTVLLEVPGPVALPPGQVNPSRPRARYLLYYQAFHRAASPWRFDFNFVAPSGQAPWLATWRALDPVEQVEAPVQPPSVAALLAAGVGQVMLHPRELGGRAPLAREALREAGWERVAADDEQELWAAP
ncbi:MAG: hypothetical protein ABIO70_25685 [Pseudomonadota bacterium]